MSELLDELPTAHVEFALRNGAVGEWLVLGPLVAALAEPTSARNKVARQLALNTLFVDADEITQLPAERATSTVTVAEGVMLQGIWRVVNTQEDHWVDLAQHVSAPHMLCAWTYAQVVLSQRGGVPLQLTVASPTQVWINGEAVYSFDELPDSPTNVTFDAALDEGTNEILIRIANVGVGDVAMMVALQIPGAEGVVKLPTLLEPVRRRQKLAAVMAQAYLLQDVYNQDQRIVLHWPNELQMIDALTARVQTPSGRIYGETNPMIQKGTKVDFGIAKNLPDGDYEILLQPQFEEYYVQDMRVQRRIPFQVRNGQWSSMYYGSHSERRQEALENATRRSGDIFAEIAKGALGQWDALRHEVVELALTQLSLRTVSGDRTLLALLGWVARMGDLPDFPQEITWALEERATLLLDHVDEPGTIIDACCHLLAGQLYPERTFADLNTGEWHRLRGEEWVLRWLNAAAQLGLPAGDGEQSYADALVALSHLVDLARSDEIAELAAAVLDKVAFQLALQCFVGAWGGSEDNPSPQWLVSMRLGPLSGVARLWWGQGAFNAECAATVALACAESYMLPEIIAAVGLDRQQEDWLRRHDAPTSLALSDHVYRVNRAAYRSGDYLLASAQGDWPTESSSLLWRVTMGPDAVIFGNRPRCYSNHPAWKQSYWRGNAAPVRVAQWRDVLVIAYQPVEDAALDFSHAYFPRAIFDDVLITEGWAMASKGNGYVALTATGGVTLVREGPTAQRELRAVAESVWLIQMGRAAHDGTFAQFAEKILALPLSLQAEGLDYTTLRGQSIRFDARSALSEAFWVDGVPQSLHDFPHLSSIYGGVDTLPATSVEIQYQEHLMRLDFSAPQLSNPS